MEGGKVKGWVVEATLRGKDEKGVVEGHGMNRKDEKTSQRFQGGDVFGSAAGCCGREG